MLNLLTFNNWRQKTNSCNILVIFSTSVLEKVTFPFLTSLWESPLTLLILSILARALLFWACAVDGTAHVTSRGSYSGALLQDNIRLKALLNLVDIRLYSIGLIALNIHIWHYCVWNRNKSVCHWSTIMFLTIIILWFYIQLRIVGVRTELD